VLKVTKEDKGGIALYRLSGSIEENVNFEQQMGTLAGEVMISCKEVPRINSVGVKSWIKYFQVMQSKGVKMRFIECSTAIVEQINLISNFTCGGSVESIYAPYACTSCKAEQVGLFKCEDIKKANFELPDLNCVKCGKKAAFDDIPEEYFSFLMR
jgi:hypothetical protein